MKKKYVIGIDFGTDSVRCVVVDTANGEQISEGLSHFKRWKQGLYCNNQLNQFRQHPLDYIESLEEGVQKALDSLDADSIENICALAIDTTGSTPCAVDRSGAPLALNKEFENNPNAMFVLWKDHTAIKEATEINTLAHSAKFKDFTKFVGGTYSSEWFWSKILHILRMDEKVRVAAFSWVEHSDWMPALLTDITDPITMQRFRCVAGHKAMWHESFDGLPSEDFFVTLDPLLRGLRSRLYQNTVTAEKIVGTISPEWAKRLGLPLHVIVSGAAMDAHCGAVGGEIQSLDMVKVIGTSTCDMVIAPSSVVEDKLVQGICGQVDGSIVPGYIGMEAGQSAFGDMYAWFKDMLLEPTLALIDNSTVLDEQQKTVLIQEIKEGMIEHLSSVCKTFPPSSSLCVLDWINGRRSPYANQYLTSAISGITIGTNAYQLYHALVESTAFGARSIQDRFTEEGISIKRVIAVGGVARKSDYVMQVLADVLQRTVYVSASDQVCALGAAMFAAVAGGVYVSIEDAQKHMGAGFDATFHPRQEYIQQYEKLYERYKTLGTFVELQTQSMG